MSYRSPVADILYSLKHVAGLDEAIESGLFGDLDAETAASVISEAGRFATEVIAPLDRVGDEVGARCENGAVFTPPGFREAYRQWAEAGWAGVTASSEYGGMGLPHSVNFACGEIWIGASMGFALCPLLSEGAIGALNAYGERGAARDLSRPIGQRRMDGHDEPHGAAGRLRPQRREDSRGTRRRRNLSRFRPEDFHHLRRARHGRQHRPSRARAPARRAPGNARPVAVSRAEISCRGRRFARGPQRRALREHRAQAGHSRLADLRHDLWRRGRGEGMAGRRGESRPRGDVRDDEQRAARRRHAGRRDRRAGVAARARLCARAPPGPERRKAAPA